jgi:SAM-dependent MidA family methyltransferase
MANANVTLSTVLRDRLRTAPQSRLPWAEVMRLALYEPGLGYYRRGVRRIGRKGDFFTSVSVGPLFGRLLAEFAYQTWNRAGRPDRFTILEQGAHDGTLARDILEGCRGVSPEFFAAVRYAIIEPDPALQQAQRETVGPEFATRLVHDAAAFSGPALFLCNELLDAFPVHRVRWDGAAWRELWVAENETAPAGIELVEGDLSIESLREELEGRGPDLPAGWTTEVCPAAATWLNEIAALPFTGPVLILDYGFTADEHFAPERPEGTLRRYLNHRMDDRVLDDLGDADLTAHVDFTRVTELATQRGFSKAEFAEQGRFLTRLFVEAFQRHGIAPDAATQRQFHTLTHPGQMGRVFHALVLRKPA